MAILWFGAASIMQAAPGDPALLKIQVIEGDGASYPLSSRATRGITVLVSDETGRPVDGAVVSFILPMDGPGGTFSSGMRTEIATTHADGRAAVWGMRWNRLAGQFDIRITAVKGQARAGTICSQFLVESAGPLASKDGSNADRGSSGSASSRLPHPHVSLGGHKWVWIGAGVVAAAVGGAVLAKGNSSGSNSAASPSGTVTLGTPSITIGHP